jgi:hypothetical protein
MRLYGDYVEMIEESSFSNLPWQNNQQMQPEKFMKKQQRPQQRNLNLAEGEDVGLQLKRLWKRKQ